MNIYQKLIEVRKAVPYLQKEAQGHQYNYVSSSQVLAAVREKMDEVGLLLIPEVVGHQVTADTVESTDKYNNLKRTTTYFTELDMQFTWVNADNPEETIMRPWYGQGVDIAGEKGVGKAMTYAEKYFLLKFFNIATDKDDPDSFQRKDDTKEPSAQQSQQRSQQQQQRANTQPSQPSQQRPTAQRQQTQQRTTSSARASDKQLACIDKMAGDKGIEPVHLDAWVFGQIGKHVDQLSKSEASDVITRLTTYKPPIQEDNSDPFADDSQYIDDANLPF